MDRVSFLIIALPLAAGIINGLFSKIINRTYAGFIACSAMTIACCCAGKIFYQILTTEILVHNIIAEWFQLGNNIINWSIYIDQLTSIMMLVVTLVSAIVHIYSLGYMEKDENLPKFLSYLSFFTFFMLALVSADNLLQLFFGWEGVGLCSYLLIGYWYKKESANNAAIKAFIVNRVGDLAFIIGIILLFIYTGQVDFAGIFVQAKDLASLKLSIIGTEFSVLDLICFLLFIGCMGKSAQIGLHIWLPDAMEGPTPVSALIHAATMVTAGIFLVARCSYLFEYSPYTLQFIAIVGGITCLFAATIAITQSDIKKIIAYSTCSQLGYMFLACGVSAYQAGIFHLVTHAFFKALLFLSAGSVIHACHEQDIFKMGGLKNKMPFTYLNFWIGSLAIIGIFPLAGFYSKDLILESAYNANFVGKIVFSLGIVAAILTAIYSLKIILLVFHGESKLEPYKFEKVHEAPLIMNLPLILLIIGSIFAGMIGDYKLGIGSFGGYFANSIYNLHINNHEEYISFLIKFFPIIAGVIGVLIAYSIYKDELYKEIAIKAKTLYKILNNKYYFDEVYETLVVHPVKHISKLTNMFDWNVIDRFGSREFIRVSNKIGSIISHLHSGYIFNYNLIILLAIVVYITYFIINFIKIL